MKTTKLIFALSLALIFAAGSNNIFALGNLKTDNPAERKAQKIAYVVRIEQLNYIQSLGGHFLVKMTDETGRMIAPAQVFRPGVSDYTFFEAGNVRGTRVAKMERLPIGERAINIPSTSKSGIFIGGTCYMFIIHPVPLITTDGIDKQ
jgi:hypothetical protein